MKGKEVVQASTFPPTLVHTSKAATLIPFTQSRNHPCVSPHNRFGITRIDVPVSGHEGPGICAFPNETLGFHLRLF